MGFSALGCCLAGIHRPARLIWAVGREKWHLGLLLSRTVHRDHRLSDSGTHATGRSRDVEGDCCNALFYSNEFEKRQIKSRTTTNEQN